MSELDAAISELNSASTPQDASSLDQAIHEVHTDAGSVPPPYTASDAAGGVLSTIGNTALNIPYGVAHGVGDLARKISFNSDKPESGIEQFLHVAPDEAQTKLGEKVGTFIRNSRNDTGQPDDTSVPKFSEGTRDVIGNALDVAGDVGSIAGAGQLVRNGIGALVSAPKAGASTVSDQILSKAQQEGYVVPPATTNPTAFNKTLEGIAGKASVAQAASVRNQVITNGLARRALGLPEDAPLTSDTLDDLRSTAGQAYEKVGNAGTIKVDPQYHADIGDLTKTSTKINKDFPGYQSGPQAQIKDLANSLRPANDTMDAGTAVELSKDLRYNANANDSMAMRTGDPTAKAMARAQRDAAEAIEDQVQRHLASIGQPELADEWNQARTQIAKSYTVQKALDGAGNVDATKLGKALKNKGYNDELQTAGDFANAFPKAARVLPGKESMPGMSPLDVYGSVATSIAAGNPLPMLMGPGRMVARSIALSGQKPKLPTQDLGNK